ncbi:MAG TPA: leucyl/phenylalanyl-tRNA--protein transferase [Polyangiaceae bacterium]|nr:leucyl/phenylalanyl-tRNA--protein transferase [Polyangiaceae bacterium]
MRSRRIPVLLPPGCPPIFPDPNLADDEGLIAVGADLSRERLLAAYDQGIFPWPAEGLPLLWWSPNPRAIMDLEHLHVSRSMRRVLASKRFQVTFDQAFEQVMIECGRERDEGTWITPAMVEAYVDLHRRGHAHSVEVWSDGELCGGLYGVQRGGLFAAESMFHRLTNASKVALITCIQGFFAAGITLFDVQFVTEHLASLGAYAIPRRDYLRRLGAARVSSVELLLLGSLREPR